MDDSLEKENKIEDFEEKTLVILKDGLELSKKVSNRIENEIYKKLYDEMNELCENCKILVTNETFYREYIIQNLLITSKELINYSKEAKNRSASIKLMALSEGIVNCTKYLKKLNKWVLDNFNIFYLS